MTYHKADTTTNTITRVYNYIAPILGFCGLVIICGILVYGLFGKVILKLANIGE